MFSKVRLDTLSDGIFGAAMTLLILDVRLPEDFHPRDGGELPHLEQGDHLHHWQVPALLLIASSLPAIALSLVNSRVALWALALNFAAPVIRVWSKRAAALDLNRRRAFADQVNGSHGPERIVQGGEYR